MIHAVECRSLWSQVRGLMFRRKIVPLLFVFDRNRSVVLHSWFVWRPFDAFFLDSSCRVLSVVKNVKPFSFVRDKGKFVLETSVNAVNARVGDRLKVSIIK